MFKKAGACIIAFAIVTSCLLACGGSEGSQEYEGTSKMTVAEKISEQSSDSQSQVETPSSIPSSSILKGPYGISFTGDLGVLETLGTCLNATRDFQTELLLPVAELVSDAASLNEVGFIWGALRDSITAEPETFEVLFLCEETFPRVYRQLYSDDLATMLDSCSAIDNFSTQRALDRCLDDTDSLLREIDQLTDRIWEINYWLEDVLDEMDRDS